MLPPPQLRDSVQLEAHLVRGLSQDLDSFRRISRRQAPADVGLEAIVDRSAPPPADNVDPDVWPAPPPRRVIPRPAPAADKPVYTPQPVKRKGEGRGRGGALRLTRQIPAGKRSAFVTASMHASFPCPYVCVCV